MVFGVFLKFYSGADTGAQGKSELSRLSFGVERTWVRQAGFRADTAFRLVDFSLAQPVFTVRQVEHHLAVTYVRANSLVRQLVKIGVLSQYGEAVYDRRFHPPDVLAVLLR